MMNSAKSFKLHRTGLSHYLYAPRRKTGYWLAGLVIGLMLLTNLGAVGDMLEEVIPIILELAEKGLDSFFEMAGISPRLAQGITAYVGLIAALMLGYVLVSQVRRLTRQTQQVVSHLKAQSRHWISATTSAARSSWTNLPWHRKLLLAVVGASIFVPLAMVLSTALGLAVAAVL